MIAAQIRERVARRLVAVVASALTILGLSCSKSSPPTQPPATPVIVSFLATPSDIMPGGNSTLTWDVRNADSLVLTPGNTRLSIDGTGHQVSPALPTEYTLAACNSAGSVTARTSITMIGAMPVIVSFEASPDTIVIDNQMQLSWQTLRTDSLVIAGVGSINPQSETSRLVQPALSGTYRAIAYNAIGRDTADVSYWVEDPASIQVPGGQYVGVPNSLISPETVNIQLFVVDSLGRVLRKTPVRVLLMAGDGAIQNTVGDSLLPDGSGAITITYAFTGILGHARIGVGAYSATPIVLEVRRNALLFGQQAQYIRLGEPWGTARVFNGTPLSIDVDPQYCQLYANYEATLGVVPIIQDVVCDELADPAEPILGVIVNTVYQGRTPEGIGIGSTAAQLTAAYGPPDTLEFDPRPPAAWMYMYNDLSAIFFTDTVSARPIIEIHLFPAPAPGGTAKLPSVQRAGRR